MILCFVRKCTSLRSCCIKSSRSSELESKISAVKFKSFNVPVYQSENICQYIFQEISIQHTRTLIHIQAVSKSFRLGFLIFCVHKSSCHTALQIKHTMNRNINTLREENVAHDNKIERTTIWKTYFVKSKKSGKKRTLLLSHGSFS